MPDAEGCCVAIPTVDREEYLREAIASVLRQTRRDLRCLVVDNGETGVARRVVDSFPDPRLSYHRNERRLSMAENWNRCVALAGDAHLLLLHDDDLLLPDFLERATGVLARRPDVAMVCGSVEIVGPKGEGRGVHRVAEADAVVDGTALFARLAQENFLRCPGVLVRRGVYAEVGGFDDVGFATDWGMWLRACLAGDVALLADPVAQYRVGYGSDTDRLMTVRGALQRVESEEKALA
ncbi:MAG TPA: glycosyltransferase, partial [Candidatus Thermoplasmatota archaeon]|nr:glycosyltransferase [Candidatus Thermoplasmatota archaeon]